MRAWAWIALIVFVFALWFGIHFGVKGIFIAAVVGISSLTLNLSGVKLFTGVIAIASVGYIIFMATEIALKLYF